jgi:hypothetical protein
MRISELTEDQKSHLAWRLDRHTYVGFITAARIARGEFGDDEIVDVFLKADCTSHKAKILARKVINFSISAERKALLLEKIRIGTYENLLDWYEEGVLSVHPGSLEEFNERYRNGFCLASNPTHG